MRTFSSLRKILQLSFFGLVVITSSSGFSKMQLLASDNPGNYEKERKLITSASKCWWKSSARETEAGNASPEIQNYLLRYSDLSDKPVATSKVCMGKIACSISDSSGLETEFYSGTEVACAFKDANASCDPKECFLKTTAYKENMAAEDHQMALERSKQNSNSDDGIR